MDGHEIKVPRISGNAIRVALGETQLTVFRKSFEAKRGTWTSSYAMRRKNGLSCRVCVWGGRSEIECNVIEAQCYSLDRGK